MDVLRTQHHPTCYPTEREEALEFFRQCVESQPVAEAVPRDPSGVVTPHIDFRVSTVAYAKAFAPLIGAPLPETYLILGVGHRSGLEWNLDHRDYETPLGRAICDRELVGRLSAGTPPGRLFEPSAHEGEHSIEFALVWLQALHAQRGEVPVRFVPTLCGGLHEYVQGLVEWEQMTAFHQLAERLGEVLRSGGTRVIVSIDGCHMGPRFQHSYRVTPKILEETARWEERLWACVAEGDARGFLEWMRREGNERYFDGVGALALLLEAGAGAYRPRRTHYEQWFTRRDASVVTFSSGVITKS